jgi:cytochrome c551/c552
MSSKDIKPATVDKVAEAIKQSNPSMSSEKARAIARESAERIARNNKR